MTKKAKKQNARDTAALAWCRICSLFHALEWLRIEGQCGGQLQRLRRRDAVSSALPCR
jgi:hypothetical protein